MNSAASDDPALRELLDYLRDRGFDADKYKEASFVRRIRRRMDLVSVENFALYRDYLEANPDELAQLFGVLFVRVTSFFRDAEAWQSVALHLPEVIDPRDDVPIRVWSAGCATGEEPYTLAMMLAELLGLDALNRRVRIFATDIDERALVIARAATYPLKALAPLPTSLFDKYWTANDRGAVIQSELRRVVVFGRHDLTRDAPIPHVDLVTCRNALMYFNATTQEKILERLAFALNPGGLLFLGKAEMVLHKSDLLAPIDLKHRLFARAGSVSRTQIRLASETCETISEVPNGNDCEIERLEGELRRAHAELVATCEELQATNEELQTFNEELRQTSTELWEKTSLFASVLDSLPTGIAVLDGDLRIQKWTARMDELCGKSDERVEGKRFDDPRLGVPGHITSAVRVCLGQEQPADVVLSCPTASGKAIRCRVAIVPTLGSRERGVIVQVEEVRP